MTAIPTLPDVWHSPVDTLGREWTARHFVQRDAARGPGWFVFARRPEYGGHYVRLVARPDRPAKAHQSYSGRVFAGWRTHREAARVCDALTAMLLPSL